MALEAHPIRIPSGVPPGNFASKLIQAIHRDTRNHVFPAEGPYAESRMSAYRGGSAASFPKDIRVDIPLEHPQEGRNNPQPTKGFMNWKVPSRYQSEGSRERQLLEDIERSKSAASHFSRPQHGATQTTHFAPPLGKFEPIRSEQQEHMAEVLKKEAALKQHLNERALTLPKIARSAPLGRTTSRQSRQSEPLTLEPRTYTAAQRWLRKNPGKEELANKVLQQTGRTEVDRLLENTLQPNAKKAVREWLKTATEADRQAALKFFRSIGGSQLLGGPSGYHPNRNIHGNRNARLMAVLGALQEKHGQPDQPSARMDDKLAVLMKAAQRRHLRLLSPNTRMRRMEFQTWHHMPVYPQANRADNVLAMYTQPRAPKPQSFKIHPEWGA